MNIESSYKYLIRNALDQFQRSRSWEFSVRLQEIGLNYYTASSEIVAFERLIGEAQQAIAELPAIGEKNR